MWVCVSDEFELKHVLVKILNSASAFDPNPIHQENFKNFDVEQLQNHLRNTLVGQKFLLILDDVWNEDRFKWEELKDIIQGVTGAEGSKLILTTRSHTVANVTGTSSPHILQ
ncbi:disease resistance protein, partial [Trifolium medium]|nr:disease resistance protein [Trifolium medium]